ncbi:hypothetical protein DFH08DRAFT_694783 [Mycena albidolilacea]|uniref:Uncharacterized protein n=1 Tax=Mycena albidolilacea TaxID=1033008 RepID=A0AAD7EUF2_9AGAR|nr:hypothetical protein DFH08DRAFT_694783 [Mycena albidolilacea]
MTVGGMSQYLTAVQGMPEDVEEYLDKRIKNFVWAGKSKAPTDYEIMFLPKSEGGRDLLSIKDRNSAIESKNLKDFVTTEGENRAKWCSLSDNRLRKDIQGNTIVDPKVRDSPFKQTWKPLQKCLPRPLKRMLKTARKFKLTFNALALSKNIKEELPIFFHMGGNRDMGRRNNSKCAQCLRDCHSVRSTGDVLATVERNYQRHNRRRNCACQPCREDRLRGCIAPYLCLEEAIKMLDCLYEKWDPRVEVNQRAEGLSDELK